MKSLFIVLSLFTLPAGARWMTIKESGSVIEKYSLVFDVAADGSFSESVDYVVRVQAEDAKTSASLFQIDYNAFTDKVEILEAFTMNGKEKIPVEASAIEDRDKGEAKDYDAMKVRSVVFPQVQIGSVLHVRYVIHTNKPLMQDRWSNEVSLTPGAFVEKLDVKINSARPLFYEVQDPRGWVSVHEHDKKHLEVTNRKILPGWVHGEKDPFFHPGGNSFVWFSTHRKWPEFFATVDKDFENVVGAELPKVLRGWVKEAASLKDPEKQILFLMERMSREFRYFGDWRRHNGGIVPRTLSEIEKSRYGDCKDLASLLAAMLRGLKMEANVALVRRGENPWIVEPDYVLPNMARFNHAIVQVKVSGRTYWLDATNPVSSLEPFPDISGRPAWIIKPGAGHFDRLPPSESRNFVHQHEYQYFFKSVSETDVKVDANLKQLAPYHLANELMLTPRSEVLTETLEYFSEGQDVQSFNFTKEPRTGRALADMNIKLEYKSGRVTFEAGKNAFFVIPDGFLAGPFFETESRESDLRLSETPFSFSATRRLKNSKLLQEATEPCQINSQWMDLRRTITVDGHDVLVQQNVDLKRPFITKAEFRSPAFRKLQQATEACFYRSGVLIGPRAWDKL